MDYKFLDRVIDQIVNETTIDNNRGVIESPFFSFIWVHNFLNHFSSSIYSSTSSFIDHCRDVYGLNVQEIKYVWKEYRETIIDKINNGL